MSMTSKEMTWLQRYQDQKPAVQAALDALADPEQLGELVNSSTGLAGAINALTISVKYRGLLGKGLAHESGHEFRLVTEQEALTKLSRAAADKAERSKADAVARAQKRAADEQSRQAMAAPDAFPTLGQASSMQPGRKVYVPPKAKRGWEK